MRGAKTFGCICYAILAGLSVVKLGLIAVGYEPAAPNPIGDNLLIILMAFNAILLISNDSQ